MQKKHILRTAAMSLAMILLLTSNGLALTLRSPQKGDEVADLQRALKQLGYYTKTIDGSYGSGTKSAVRAFQKAQGLSVDGVAGPKTIARLETLTKIDIDGDGSGSSGTITPVIPADEGLFGGVYTTLQSGSSGNRVSILQRALKALGFTVSENGVFDSATNTAVKAFQRSQGLTVDGKAGKNTLKKLESFFDAAGNLISGPIVTDPPKDEETEAPELPEDNYDIPTRTLRYGMSGEDVKYTQQRLYSLNYYTGSRDGRFGADMQSAVKAFQRKNGLTADGVVGPATIKVLFSSSAIAAEDEDATPTPTPTPTPAPEATPSRTLRYGTTGEDVKLLQARLIELGYMAGIPSGSFGTTTQSAVKAFQKANSLTADGVAGAKTYKKLFSDSALPAQNATVTTPPASKPYPDRNLYDGCSGEDVKDVQQRLKDLGYLDDKVDGKYGPNTELAMRSFQIKNGLSGTGMGNEATYKVLFSVDAIPANGISAGGSTGTETYTNLQLGSTGNAVIRLQQMLSTLKYSVNINGYFDEATYAAVLAFQKRNGLTPDGIAGVLTQTKLYSGSCVTGDTVLPEEETGSGSTGNGGGPAVSQVKLLHWFNDIKPTIRSGQTVLVYEPASNSSFYLKLYSLGRHADSEPLTANDTAIMKAAWGGKFSWSEKPVYIRLPNGTWCIASMHSMPHLSGALDNNNFEGHLCVHFPRTMTECAQNDPKNGVRHQNDIRKHWKKITGEDIPW